MASACESETTCGRCGRQVPRGTLCGSGGTDCVCPLCLAFEALEFRLDAVQEALTEIYGAGFQAASPEVIKMLDKQAELDAELVRAMKQLHRAIGGKV